MKTCFGFTLLEIGVVLLIIGVVTGAALPLVVSGIRQGKVTQARDQLAAAADELIGYAMENGKLPESFLRTDVWGGTVRYAAAPGLTTSICSRAGDEPEYTLHRVDQDMENIAFVLSSDGPDRQQGVFYSDNQHADASALEDDLLAFVTFFQLYKKVCGPTVSTEESTGSYVSFDENFDGFDADGVAVGDVKKPGHADFGDFDGDGEQEVLLYDDAALDGGTMGSVCVWYQGASGDGYCASDGICPLDQGVRVYFRIRTSAYVSASGQLSGLTFTLLGADEDLYGSTSLADICGGVAQNNGFGGRNLDDDGEKRMFAPKVGVEIDFASGWPCDTKDAPCDPDDGANHAAIVYWGTRDSEMTLFSQCGGNYSGYHQLYDDVLHGYGEADDECEQDRSDKLYATFDEDRSVNPSTGSAGFAAVADTDTPWLQDGDEHSIRIEYAWDETTGKLNVTAWVDCTDCADLETAFSGSCSGQCRKLDDSLAIGAHLVPYMNAVRFGWTAGSTVNGEVYIEGFSAYFY